MKLEYLDDISDGGKYKDVISDNLVRLYEFGQKETTQLINLIYQRLITERQSLDLSATDFIEPINCKLILQLSSNDEGIVKTDDLHFICRLTEGSYKTAMERMNATVDNGYHWLCDTSKDNIDFLFSAGGTW